MPDERQVVLAAWVAAAGVDVAAMAGSVLLPEWIDSEEAGSGE